jgi:hypothetical protein
MSREFSISSELAVAPATLWDHAVNPLDVNAEFRPLLSMIFPAGVDDVTAGWEPGRFRFRSFIKLGGVIPIEYDDLCFEEVVAGQYFLERSSMFTQSEWEHRREIEALEDGARLTDSVAFSSRIEQLEPLFEKVFQWVFRWRHYKLQRIYGHLYQEH